MCNGVSLYQSYLLLLQKEDFLFGDNEVKIIDAVAAAHLDKQVLTTNINIIGQWHFVSSLCRLGTIFEGKADRFYLRFVQLSNVF
jgi:hypothetical protein